MRIRAGPNRAKRRRARSSLKASGLFRANRHVVHGARPRLLYTTDGKLFQPGRLRASGRRRYMDSRTQRVLRALQDPLPIILLNTLHSINSESGGLVCPDACHHYEKSSALLEKLIEEQTWARIDAGRCREEDRRRFRLNLLVAVTSIIVACICNTVAIVVRVITWWLGLSATARSDLLQKLVSWTVCLGHRLLHLFSQLL